MQPKVFDIKDHQDAQFLLGIYRTDKPQLPWILGEKPLRDEVLYNIRYNDNLFATRHGGDSCSERPDYVFIYNPEESNFGVHLFPCMGYSQVSESDMQVLQYPNPKGSYKLFHLGKEIAAFMLDIPAIMAQVQTTTPQRILYEPIVMTAQQLAPFQLNTVVGTFENPQAERPILRFIDLFAGIGGIRCGLEQAARESGYVPRCVFTSEIKPHALRVLHDNHPTEDIAGDITKIKSEDIPDFDILCAGFPCQAFSSAGKRNGFADTRGTMFFEVERILRDKQPQGFILENVEGLVNHDGGKTLSVIVERLQALNYEFDFRVLNSKDFGVPQERKRIYIVGSKYGKPNLEHFPTLHTTLKDVLEIGVPTNNSPFIRNLLAHYTVEQLQGKSIKDKRGGETNIHSWDLEIKGAVSEQEKQLLNAILTNRRKKQWAEEIGIDWMDGMPLTVLQISTFYHSNDLQSMLDKLTQQGYLKYEYPKKLVRTTNEQGLTTTHREYDTSKPMGYNIVTGKLSFEINKILSPDEVAPTLVAMDMNKLYVTDNGGLRRLTLREGLRLCGYPDDIVFNVSEKEGFDLLGNTVVVPVIKAVALRLLQNIKI